MPGYILFDILQTMDQKKMEEYARRIGPTVERFGGRYLIRGGKTDVVEGDWDSVRPVMIEFPNLEQAHQ